MRLVVRNEGEGDCDDWYGVTAVLIAMSSVPASIWEHKIQEKLEGLFDCLMGGNVFAMMTELAWEAYATLSR